MKILIVYVVAGFILGLIGLNWWQIMSTIIVVIIAEYLCKE